jgi:hypothetical protein
VLNEVASDSSVEAVIAATGARLAIEGTPARF